MATLKELLAKRKAGGPAPVLGSKVEKPVNPPTPNRQAGMPWHTNPSLERGGMRDEGRELGAVDGQTIPDEWPGAGTGDFDWKQAYGAFAAEMCVVMEPAPSGWAWLAIGRKDRPGRPLLLARLPLHSLGAGERAEAF